ncbi:MAG: gamma carbonic anhydrase family protein [Eubacteriales bacterium]|nr:gamma carbonic anhydrase family protein [Eubacteriales bacterium]
MPIIDPSCFIADGAHVISNVSLAKDCSVWFNAVLRGDSTTISIDEGSNIQDNAVIHGDPGYPVTIGKNVTVGHSAIVHGCSIADNTLIGMGAIILNGSRIGRNCLIGAGALVTENSTIPDNSVVIGTPGKIRRQLTPDEAESNLMNARHYVQLAKEYKKRL